MTSGDLRVEKEKHVSFKDLDDLPEEEEEIGASAYSTSASFSKSSAKLPLRRRRSQDDEEEIPWESRYAYPEGKDHI